MKYFLGLSNSRLISWYGNLILPNFGKDVFPKLNPKDIKEIPIRPIDFDNPVDVTKHNKMVEIVERMLELNNKKANENNPDTQRFLETQISSIDHQIDHLVYDLYNLSSEEIELIEANTK